MSDPFEQLLDRRAEELAQSAQTQDGVARRIPLLRLLVGEQRYALRAEYVDGVTTWADWTRVPGAPSAALGVIAWRGAIVVVLNLGQKLGQDGGEPQHVIVLEIAGRRLGLAVSSVDEVATLQESLNPPLGLSPQIVVLLEGVLDDGTALINAQYLLTEEASGAL